MQADTLLTQLNDISLGHTFYDRELPKLIKQIKNDCGWKMGDLKSQPIINEFDKKVLLTALHTSTEIVSTQVDEFILIHVLEGSLKISFHKESINLLNGQKFTLTDRVKYKLKALSETFFLMIISPKKI